MDRAMEQNAIEENYILDQLLMQSGLIVPYSKDYILLLEKGCRNFIDEKLDNGFFTDLALSYTKNSCPDLFKNYIQGLFEEAKELPPCVWNTLVFYVVYLAIIDNDNENEKAIYSCMLQNILIRCKGHWEELKFPSYLIRLYGFMDTYLLDNQVGDGDFPHDFLGTIFSDIDSLRTSLNAEEEQRKLEYLSERRIFQFMAGAMNWQDYTFLQ